MSDQFLYERFLSARLLQAVYERVSCAVKCFFGALRHKFPVETAIPSLKMLSKSVPTRLKPGPDSLPFELVTVFYESKFKEKVSTFGGHTYDAMTILAKAIEVGGEDREKVRAALENIKGLIGTAGTFNFSETDHGGLGLDAFTMLTVKNGQFVLLEK